MKRDFMRVGTISNLISFGFKTKMAIPTDIDKILKTAGGSNSVPAFGGMNFKPVAVPICDSFVHVLH